MEGKRHPPDYRHARIPRREDVRLKLRYFFALTLAGALVLGACGGDDDDSGSSGNQDQATQPAGGSNATKTSSEPTKSSGDATKPAASATAEDVASVFDKLAGNGITKTYQATYDMEITTSGATQKGTAVMASKPPKLATKVTFGGTGFAGTFAIITDGKDTYTCTDFGAGGSCSKSSGVDDALTKGFDVQKAIKEARNNSEIKELAKRTIAGKSSRCFETKDKTDGTVTTFCLDEKDSIMTYMEVGGITKLSATNIATSVDDKLFELPYPVK